MQFMWNRVNEFHGNPSPKEYGETDIRMTLETLGLPPLTHFIVGHNPLWNDGGTTGLWENVIGIKNHHIIYSGSGSKAPYYTLEGGALKAKFPNQSKRRCTTMDEQEKLAADVGDPDIVRYFCLNKKTFEVVDYLNELQLNLSTSQDDVPFNAQVKSYAGPTIRMGILGS